MEAHIIRDESELTGIAREILSHCVPKKQATVIALEGDLGAGKTTLTQALARELGIEEHVTSPTFVIMKRYTIPRHQFFRTLIHVDAYRIEDEHEIQVLGFEEILSNPETLVIIEWPLRIASYLPNDALHVSIAMDVGGTHTFLYGI